jgi:uncharacterized protein (DUF427 family)
MTTLTQSDDPVREFTSEGRRVRVEPSPRWIRGKRLGETVIDSKHALLVLPDNRPPTYYFPKGDVQVDLLTASDRVAKFPLLGETRFWHLDAKGDRIENAAFEHTALPEELAPLRDHLAFKWSAIDHWYEEEEEIFVHARSPYTRVDTIQSSRHIRVEVDGETVADSHRPILLFETGLPTRYYLPMEDVRTELLTPTDTHTQCPYKGTASYWSLAIGDKQYPDYVWGYPEPISEAGKVKDLLCFYNEWVDIYVDGELQERPKTPFS